MKVLEDNRGENLGDLGFSVNNISEAQSMKETVGKPAPTKN